MKRITVLTMLLTGGLMAAEPPPVPDPYGLGERLALVDVLRETYHQAPVAGASLEELRAAYVTAWRAAAGVDAAEAEAQAAAVRERDEVARLRRRITDRFHREPDPALDLAALKALAATLEADKAAADAERLEQRLREPERETVPRPRQTPAAPPVVARSAPGTEPELPTLAQGPRVHAQNLDFRASGVAACRLFTGSRTLMGVQFGPERAREFHGVFERMTLDLLRGHGPSSAIVLLGHGNGSSIAGEAIDAHLRRWKTFYETLGGTRPAAPVECLVIASCSRGSPVQMGEIRDGLGYYPTWRVATADRTYANALTVIAAFAGAVAVSDDPPFRGIYRWGKGEESPASIAEVGRDGARGNLRYYDIHIEAGDIAAKER